jgi:hypothetical protein
VWWIDEKSAGNVLTLTTGDLIYSSHDRQNKSRINRRFYKR